MNSLVVSGALSIVEKHMKYAPSLFANLSMVNPAFDELVIVASGLSARSLRGLKLQAQALTCRVTFISVPLLPLGINRNLGWLGTSGDVVCFLDSDDLYSPHYRAEIERMFIESGADVVLHSFVALETRNTSLSRFPEFFHGVETEPQALGSHDLIPLNGLGEGRDRTAELTKDGSLSRLVLPDWWSSPVHQGHASVRRSIIGGVRFIQELGQRNEDGVFIKDCLEASMKVAVYSEALSAYSLHTSAIYWDRLRIQKLAKRLLQFPLFPRKKVQG